MSPEELSRRLNTLPRLGLGHYPTPLEPLPRLSRRLGGPALWLKRDDNLGPAMGGNKGRKLEFILAEVQDQGRRKVVTYGGLQSNHARMTAAACARLGLEAHLLYFARKPPSWQGNLLLNQLLGAKMHFIPFGGGSSGSMTLEQTSRLVGLVSRLVVGPGAYFMPVGGHSVSGGLGYVAAALELVAQLGQMGLAGRPVTAVVAAGTGGTLAGLMAGLALLASPVRLLGIDVGRLWRDFAGSIARLATALCHKLGEEHVFTPGDVPLIEGRYAGPGYAIPTPGMVQAVALLAQSEGVLLDPVYTGKAFAGMLDLVAQGHFRPEEQVIFWHTGGLPGLWAFGQAFEQA